ncbi:MAG: hypothetical protein M1818_001977 [Claussenomyces sp. TS43310]|nr:MAG: hypothetical protein M1818_001977 [Claussenomyces sp. TS43310]
MVYVHISKEWKWPQVLVALLVLEFGGTVASLCLFGLADDNLYRTKLWQIGGDNGFCSSPSQILYAYANYRPIPTTPLVWSSFITSFNVVVSVLSMFILLVKVVMFAMHIWYPLLSSLTNAVIVALWAVSIYGQAGPDYSDPEHPMHTAWYVVKSCKYALPTRHYGYCMQAKGAFAVSVVMMSIFFFNLVLGIYSMIPNKAQREAKRLEREERAAHMPKSMRLSSYPNEKSWEMGPVPQSSMKQPFTPRTTAFNTLDSRLPLRNY